MECLSESAFGDLDLCYVVLSKDGTMPEILFNYVQELHPRCTLDNLTHSLHSLLEYGSSSPSSHIYTKHTAVEFHILLVSVLAGFITSLDIFLHAKTDVCVQITDAELDGAYFFMFLLWHLAHSSILVEHLSFLQKAV